MIVTVRMDVVGLKFIVTPENNGKLQYENKLKNPLQIMSNCVRIRSTC